MNEFHEEDEEYFCRFTFGQFVSLALLEVVALFFVFYLGARYGTTILGREDQPAADRLTASEMALIDAERGSVDHIKYTFPEELTRKPPPPPPAPKIATPKPVLTKPQPAAAPQPAPPAQPTTSRGVYSIQVGSYRQAGGAAAKVNQWQSKGYDAFLSIGEVANSGTWYRVRIGTFKTRDSARKFLEQLSSKENVSAIIVRSNT